MRLTLVDDNGTVLNSWYLLDEETTPAKVQQHIDGELPVYADREEYETMMRGAGSNAYHDSLVVATHTICCKCRSATLARAIGDAIYAAYQLGACDNGARPMPTN